MSCQYYNAWQDEDGGYHNAGWYSSEDGEPCTPSSNQGGQQQQGLPNWVINQGGATGQSGTYSQTLQAILSGIALFQHQPYVPTTVQPVQNPPVIYNPQGNYGAGYSGNSRANAFGGIQNYVEQHPMAVLVGLGALALLMFKPPLQRVR